MKKEAYKHLRKLARHTKWANIGSSVRFGVGGGLLGAMVGNYVSKPKYKLLGTGLGGLLGAGAGAWIGSLDEVSPAQQTQIRQYVREKFDDDNIGWRGVQPGDEIRRIKEEHKRKAQEAKNQESKRLSKEELSALWRSKQHN